MAETATDEDAAKRWDRRVRALVPEPIRASAQMELRDRDAFPLDVLHELPGASCRAAHELVRATLAVIDEEERRALAHWLMPDMAGAAGFAPGLAALYVLARLLHDGFYDPRLVLDRDAGLRGRALDAVVALADRHDDDRLVPLAFFDEVTPYYLRKGGAYFQYHPFLRRYLSARINTDFTSLLVRARNNAELDVRVAIDLDHISDTPLTQFFERDYWYGPKLTRESLDDPHALGVTSHWRSPELEHWWGWPLERTEFRWTGDRDLKWLQVEELSPLPPASSGGSLAHGKGVGRGWDLCLNRYLHCTRDTKLRLFTHLDGAIRAYEPAAYEERLGTKMQHTGKAAHYRKVFRIDGPIPDDDWYQLVVMFYRQNEMVAEYLHAGFQHEVAERNNWPEDAREKLAPPPTHEPE